MQNLRERHRERNGQSAHGHGLVPQQNHRLGAQASQAGEKLAWRIFRALFWQPQGPEAARALWQPESADEAPQTGRALGVALAAKVDPKLGVGPEHRRGRGAIKHPLPSRGQNRKRFFGRCGGRGRTRSAGVGRARGDGRGTPILCRRNDGGPRGRSGACVRGSRETGRGRGRSRKVRGCRRR